MSCMPPLSMSIKMNELLKFICNEFNAFTTVLNN